MISLHVCMWPILLTFPLTRDNKSVQDIDCKSYSLCLQILVEYDMILNITNEFRQESLIQQFKTSKQANKQKHIDSQQDSMLRTCQHFI